MVKEVAVYTDGACSGNPGPGGWAAISIHGEHTKEISGGESHTTNNRMEILAVIEALRMLKQRCKVKVYSDSAYVVNCFLQGWMKNWKKNDWKNSKQNPVENKDLWMQLDELVERHEVIFIKVKGHSNNRLNNRCDELAVAAAKNFAGNR